MQKVNLAQAFASIDAYWSPRLGGSINGYDIRLTKLKGEFVWHHHEVEDELFLVIRGRMLMRFRDHEVEVGPGEYIIVPHGVEHQPASLTEDCDVFMVEPHTTLNTGNLRNERTVENPLPL